jgi:hypothetical protein
MQEINPRMPAGMRTNSTKVASLTECRLRQRAGAVVGGFLLSVRFAHSGWNDGAFVIRVIRINSCNSYFLKKGRRFATDDKKKKN